MQRDDGPYDDELGKYGRDECCVYDEEGLYDEVYDPGPSCVFDAAALPLAGASSPAAAAIENITTKDAAHTFLFRSWLTP